MREAVLNGVVAILCCIALFRPRIGILTYTWFALMRPDALAFAVGHKQLSLFLGAATALGSIRLIGRTSRIFTNPFSLVLVGLQSIFFITSLVAVDPKLSEEPYSLQLRVICMVLLQLVLIQSLEDLQLLIIVMALSMGALGLKFGAYGLLHRGVAFSQGFTGFLADNNNLALALVMTVALCWYMRPLAASRWLKLSLFVAMGSSMLTVVLTNSRGGTLSLVAVLLLIAMRSERSVAVFAVMTGIMACAILLLGNVYLNRMATLKDPTKEASANSRFVLAGAGLRMARDYPITGVGFGGDNERALLYRYTDPVDGPVDLYLHNTYLQVLVDSGPLAAILYVMLLGGSIIWLQASARRARRDYKEWLPIPLALQTALIAYSIGSYFLSRVTFDFSYMLLMCTASWFYLDRQLRVEATHAHAEEELPEELYAMKIEGGRAAEAF